MDWYMGVYWDSAEHNTLRHIHETIAAKEKQ